MRCSDQPGYKVDVPRHFLETLADQMAEPETWAYMLREHARTIRKQLTLVEKAGGQGVEATGYFLRHGGWGGLSIRTSGVGADA